MEIVIISVIHTQNIIKDITVKVFDLMSLKNKTKQIKLHQSSKYVCRLDPIVCNKSGIKKNANVSA